MADALDHRSVVQAVRENDTVGQFTAQSRQCRIVGYITRRKDERSLLGVEICNRLLERHSVLVVARDVPSTSSACSVSVEGFVHRLEHLRVATHTEVVVGAPHRHLVLGRLLVRAGEFLGQTVDVVEVSVRFVLVLFVEFIVVKALVVERGGFGRRGNSEVGRLASDGLEGRVGKRNRSCPELVIDIYTIDYASCPYPACRASFRYR